MASEVGEAVKDLQRFAPGVTIAAASSSAFVITARVARSAAYAAGVSCATPVLGTLWGIASVGGASALAGQTARVVMEWPSGDLPKNIQAWRGMTVGGLVRRPLETLHRTMHNFDNATTRTELVKDAIFGSLVYAVLGRGVQTALPSDISYPGALANKSLSANGAHYASDAQRKTLAPFFKKGRVSSLREPVGEGGGRPHASEQNGLRQRRRSTGSEGRHLENQGVELNKDGSETALLPAVPSV